MLRWMVLIVLLIQIVLTSRPPRLILISFDGFRPDYVTPERTPNLFKLSKNGVVAANIKSMFTTKTFPNHFSIVTGLYEENHGIVHNVMFDPLFNETFEESNTDSKWWDNGVSLPIWVANERHNDGKDRWSGSMMWPGSAAKIAQRLPYHLQKFSRNLDWQTRINIVLKWLTDKYKPANFVSIYFDQPDRMAHMYGPFSKQVYAQVERADSIIGYLLSQLKLNNVNDVNLIIVSDHGMAEVSVDRVIELDTFINPDWYKMYGTSPVFNILPEQGFEDKVYNTMKNASSSRNFTVYRTANVPEEYHYSNHRRILKIVLVADDGWEVTRNKSAWNITSKVWGNHGYNNSLPSMKPLFIANGPMFKKGYKSTNPVKNIDIYPLMCYVLRLLPLSQYPNNGSFEHIRDILIPYSESHLSTASDKIFSVVVFVAMGFAVIVACGIAAIVCAAKKRKDQIDLDNDAVRTALKKRLSGSGLTPVSKERGEIEEKALLLDIDNTDL